MSEPTKYAEFVVPELSKSRLDTQWSRIVERRPADRKRFNVTVPAVGILVTACALGVMWWPRESRSVGESVWEGSVVASDDAPVEMTLAEGTRIQVEPRSEVKLLHSSAHAVQVRLGHGSARFQVSKRRTRRFSVNLGKVEVVVTGTQFRVVRKAGGSEERVQVAVEEGSVEIHRQDGRVVSLHAGEDWSTVVTHDRATPDDAPSKDVPHDNAPLDHNTSDETFEPSVSLVGGQVQGLHQRPATAGLREAGATEGVSLPESGLSEVDSEFELAAEADDLDPDERARADADEVDSQDELDEGRDSATRRDTQRARRRRRAREAAVDAGELLDHANLARRAGRLDDAAELYADLVARYPRDRRASLAAFELGRLRMDSLRDVRGAVQALERALKLDARGAFAEDALARLVLAEEARGDRAACARARTRYLARYPEGVHAQHVAERCGGT